jgi:hypothetical protein
VSQQLVRSEVQEMMRLEIFDLWAVENDHSAGSSGLVAPVWKKGKRLAWKSRGMHSESHRQMPRRSR